MEESIGNRNIPDRSFSISGIWHADAGAYKKRWT